MASDPITGFQRRYMSFGDMLGEWFYGFLMVAVVCGIIGGYSDILLASNLGYGRVYLTVVLVVLTFGVNITWGIIDGTTVIYGGLTDKADLERIIIWIRSGTPPLTIFRMRRRKRLLTASSMRLRRPR